MLSNPFYLDHLIRNLPISAQKHLAGVIESRANGQHVEPIGGGENDQSSEGVEERILSQLARMDADSLNDVEDFARYLAGCASSTAPRAGRHELFSSWEPTPRKVILDALTLAELGPSDLLYDLGCGDGRVVSIAARVFGARAIGFEINPRLVRRARRRVNGLGLSERAQIRTQSMVHIPDLYAATVVYLYLPQSAVNQVMPVILRRCRKGTRLVAVSEWPLNWSPTRKIELSIRGTPWKWPVGVWCI